MNHKQMPRLGGAIASTILSLFSAVSLVGVDKAQAALLTYNIGDSSSLSFFKVNDSSVTGIEYEQIPVSEGRLYDFTLGVTGAKEYYDLEGATALFAEGVFRGLIASGGDILTQGDIFTPDEPGGTPFYLVEERYIFWEIYYTGFFAYSEHSRRYFNYQSYIDDGSLILELYEPLYRPIWWGDVSYTLVNTETVPEPLTAGGTALALAGLSWLKHKKKMAA